MESIRMTSNVSQELEVNLIPRSSMGLKLHKSHHKTPTNSLTICNLANLKIWKECLKVVSYLHRKLWLFQRSYQGQASSEPQLCHIETLGWIENRIQRICQAKEKEVCLHCRESFHVHYPSVYSHLCGSYPHRHIVVQRDREPRTWTLYRKKTSFL